MTNLVKFLPYAGWPLAILFFFLWGDAKDGIIEERENCNAAVIQTQLDEERLLNEATRKNYEIRLQDMASQAERERESREIAEAAKEAALAGAAARDKTISRLMQEAFDDESEIPDSNQCLNAFVPEPALDGLRDD